MMKYGEKFENFFRKGAQILAFSKRNFFFRSPFRFKKFNDALYAWKQRILDSIYQRFEVIRIFALSRVPYVAAVLPIGRVMVKKFEKLMGKFIWNFTGKILRVSMNDLKNTRLSGGLQLPCIERMANSLLVDPKNSLSGLQN